MRGTAKNGGATHLPEHAALAERLLSSAEFGRSPRLRELLRYLWDRASKDPTSQISEYQIGVAIYAWRPDYDSGADPIVRVQVSQLRKKLEHYFATEGRNEPLVMVIPRGSYSPQVQPREALTPTEEPASPGSAAPSEPVRNSGQTWRAVAGAAAISALLTAAVMWNIQKPASGAGHAGNPTPSLDRFWKTFQNGRPTQVVMSDSSHLILQDILGRGIGLHSYRNSDYPAQALAGIQNRETRAAATNITRVEMTGTQDAQVAARIALQSARYGFSITLISARAFSMPQPSNLVLLGHNKTNPWIELLEGRMNFRYEFDYAKGSGRLVNKAPRPGERPSYSAVYGEHGYCVVFCDAKPMDEGAALVIFGTDVSSIAAGAQFISDENSLRDLYQRLGTASNAGPARFEALLETQLLGSLAPEFHIVSARAR